MAKKQSTTIHQIPAVFGLHVVEQMVVTRPDVILCLYVDDRRQDQRVNRVIDLAKQQGVSIQYAKSEFLDKLSGGVSHQGVGLQCQTLSFWQESDLAAIVESATQPFLLVLDGVQDPHNLGACLRTAHALGVDAVIVPQRRSCGLTSVVHKVSCGASVLTPLITVVNLARTLKMLAKSGVWMVGLDAGSDQTISVLDLNMPLALVMGSEGEGARRLSLEHCDYMAKIPMIGQLDSLNVSVASSIAMYEVSRQRMF